MKSDHIKEILGAYAFVTETTFTLEDRLTKVEKEINNMAIKYSLLEEKIGLLREAQKAARDVINEKGKTRCTVRK